MVRWSEDEYTLAGQGGHISRPAVVIQLIEGGSHVSRIDRFVSPSRSGSRV